MWGGVVLHELRLPFLSPTINLYILPKDYLKLLSDLKRYIQREPLIEDAESSAKKGYPVGLLGDIRLWFVHYRTFEEARRKWLERCARVKWDNLYIMMVERDGCTREDIEAFDRLPYVHKVIFTAEAHADIQSAHCIPNSVDNNGWVMSLTDFRKGLTGRRIIDSFDYVGFFNER